VPAAPENRALRNNPTQSKHFSARKNRNCGPITKRGPVDGVEQTFPSMKRLSKIEAVDDPADGVGDE